jgi:hypothetical protein
MRKAPETMQFAKMQTRQGKRGKSQPNSLYKAVGGITCTVLPSQRVANTADRYQSGSLSERVAIATLYATTKASLP